MRPPAPAPPRACVRKFFSVGTEFYFRACGISAAHVRNFRAAGRRIIGSFCLILPGARAAGGGHGAHRVFCFPVRLEGAHIARSGTLCREGAARRRLQAGNGSQKPRCKALGQAMWTPSKGKQRKGYVRSVSPAPPRVGMPSAPICAICGKQNRGKEQEARNHPRQSAKSAGNHLKSEI